MCLYASTEIKKAENDIVCYKLLVKENNNYMTPYQYVNVPKLAIWGLMKFKAEGKFTIYAHTVTDGAIHTYSELLMPDDILGKFVNRMKYEMWECIIPKGTKYTEGTSSDMHIGYASKSIKFTRRIY